VRSSFRKFLTVPLSKVKLIARIERFFQSSRQARILRETEKPLQQVLLRWVGTDLDEVIAYSEQLTESHLGRADGATGAVNDTVTLQFAELLCLTPCQASECRYSRLYE
jgi:hypothetical protein